MRKFIVWFSMALMVVILEYNSMRFLRTYPSFDFGPIRFFTFFVLPVMIPELLGFIIIEKFVDGPNKEKGEGE